MKFRKKGIRPEPSGILTILNTCPECEEEEIVLDELHAEITCSSCGLVIADPIEYCNLDRIDLEFLMIVRKNP